MSPPAKRTTHHHGQLKEALVKIALDAARSGEIEHLSLRAAARELGVSPGAVYRHFADKDALMRELARRGFDILADDFEKLVPFDSEAAGPAEARQRLRALAGAYVRFAAHHYGLWRLMFGPAGVPASAHSSARPGTYDWLGKVLREMHAFGLVSAVTPESQFFAWTAVHGLSDLQASPALALAGTEDRIDAQCRAIERALRAD